MRPTDDTRPGCDSRRTRLRISARRRKLMGTMLASARIQDGETRLDRLHADNIDSFAGMGVDLPVELGEAVYNKSESTVLRPVAVGPTTKTDGFRVYAFTSNVRERHNGDLKVEGPAGSVGASSFPAKVLVSLVDQDNTEIIDTDRLVG